MNAYLTKTEYLAALQAIYRTANAADSDMYGMFRSAPPKWLDAGAPAHQCRHLDKMLQELVARGHLTQAELDHFHDTM